AFVFRNLERALYAGLVIFITSVVLDAVLYGRDGAKLVYIISDQYACIAERILRELNIGATYISGAGAYSGREKRVIFCVVHKNLFPKIEEIVKQEDSLAFMIVSGATEIYGEGYKSLYAEKY
ncbi:MAG: YitT family protein, partial [Lachnospiraceae bacterium]|nr:YitT family protein [Lachnospiraceae bacterium]